MSRAKAVRNWPGQILPEATLSHSRGSVGPICDLICPYLYLRLLLLLMHLETTLMPASSVYSVAVHLRLVSPPPHRRWRFRCTMRAQTALVGKVSILQSSCKLSSLSSITLDTDH